MSLQQTDEETPGSGDARSDEELIAAALAGSESSFVILIERYRPLIWRVVYRLALDADEAGDICQEVMIRLWRVLPRYQPGRNFAPWLRVIAVREALRWLRDWRPGARMISLDELDTEIPESPTQILPVVAALANQEHRERIGEALARLSPQQRTAITLRFFEEMSLNEIAEALECSEGTVKQHLFRAMNRLRRLLHKEQ